MKNKLRKGLVRFTANVMAVMMIFSSSSVSTLASVLTTEQQSKESTQELSKSGTTGKKCEPKVTLASTAKYKEMDYMRIWFPIHIQMQVEKYGMCQVLSSMEQKLMVMFRKMAASIIIMPECQNIQKHTRMLQEE